jgi:[NiFe] hydrogenase diaphorase moiety large subunit
MKWDFCRQSPGTAHYIICNADEGEPGTFKDRAILTEVSDLMFEGMTIGGYALDAKEGYLYLRGEYRYLLPHLELVLARRRKMGLLGKNICGKAGFHFDIRIRLGAGAYICGEESALIESLEGKRGAPRDRPPYPVHKGYRNLPTAVNNVETLACVARIFEKGATWFAGIGSRDSKGNKVFSVSGDCHYPGIYELPFGLTINELLDKVGAIDTQAIQLGGASGICLGPKDYGRRIAYEDVATNGSVIIIGQNQDLLDVVASFAGFFKHESCGWCVPCRVGTTMLVKKIQKFKAGRATEEDLMQLKRWCNLLRTMSRCGLGMAAPNPILSTLRNFPDLYENKLASPESFPGFNLEEALKESYEITGRKTSLDTAKE